MGVKRLKWNSLLRYAELEFEPQAPKVLEVTDELVQSLSWLTAATKQDRRLVRCTEQGALLVADAWSGLISVESAELYTGTNGTSSDIPTKVHKGVLFVTSTEVIQLRIQRTVAEVYEYYYVPPASYYWYPHSIYKITLIKFPDVGGTPSYIGVTYYD